PHYSPRAGARSASEGVFRSLISASGSVVYPVGSSTRKHAPPSAGLDSVSRPPSSRAQRRASASPSPTPPATTSAPSPRPPARPPPPRNPREPPPPLAPRPPRPAVLHLERHPPALPPRPQPDAGVGRALAVFAGVVQQIAQHLLQQVAVGTQGRRGG